MDLETTDRYTVEKIREPKVTEQEQGDFTVH